MSQLKEPFSNEMMNLAHYCKNQSHNPSIDCIIGKKLFSNEAHQNSIEKLFE